MRSRLEAENAQREKKIAQLNEFIARFSAGTRSEPGDLTQERSGAAADYGARRSNIQRPYIRFDLIRPSGKSSARNRRTFEVLRRHADRNGNFNAASCRGERLR